MSSFHAAASDCVKVLEIVIWPVFFAGLLVFLTKTSSGRQLLRRVRRFAGAGFEVELSADAAGATKADIEDTLGSYGRLLDREFERLAYHHGVRDPLKALVEHVKETFAPTVPVDATKTYRATVHVKDALFTDALYQLLDYYPKGTGAGRRFSVRFGMLGRAWRLEHSIREPEVPTNETDLIETWGMTHEQAVKAASGRQSFLCVVIKNPGGSMLGVLYLDAEPPGAFPERAIECIEGLDEFTALRDAVNKVHDEIARKGPGIARFDDA